MSKVLASILATIFALQLSADAQTEVEPPPPDPVLLFEVQASLVENTKPYTFKVYGDKEAQFFSAYGIEVQSPEGQSQLLQDFESMLPANTEADALTVEDLNFDGYADLRLMQYQSGGSASVPFFYWLYHPESNEFIASKDFSSIKSPQIDQENQRLISRSKTSASELTSEYYEVQGFSPILVRREIRSYAPDGSSKLHIFIVKDPLGPAKLLEVRSLKAGEEP